MSTSTLSFDPSYAWWPASHKNPDPVLTPSRTPSSTTIPRPSSAPAPASSASPTAQVVFTTIVSSYTSTPAHSPPTILITLARRSATPASVTATPAQRLKHQLNDELEPEQAQAQAQALEQKGKGPKHCHGLHCPATLTTKARAIAPAQRTSRSRSTSSAATSSTTPCRLIGGHRMRHRL
ncbi:hypothetical protein BC567DRAFT_229445 [Phyllosticta citribraziliensis]